MQQVVPIFVDWLTIRQTHDGVPTPIINDGHVVSIDADGQERWMTESRMSFEGSFDTTVQIRSDGHVVEFSGNISRFNRQDNLFGFDIVETVQRINQLLNLYCLPPFTAGELYRFADSGWTYTGARITRIDLTMNYATFSQYAAETVLRSLAGHHVGRQKGQLSVNGSTVEYGRGSKYVYGKVYNKHHEMLVHRRKKSGSHVADEVLEFTERVGVLREEFTLKSRFLTQNNLCWLGSVDQQLLNRVFLDRTQFRRAEMSKIESIEHLPSAVQGTYALWKLGMPCTKSKATFYRHRQALLALGVDISIPNNVSTLPLKIKTIEIAMLEAPEWYRQKYG